MTTKRVGYWPLRGDSKDWAGAGIHGETEGVAFDGDAALFDGIQSEIRIPAFEETDGSRPFTLSLEFEANDEGGFLPGGLVSRFSEDRTVGWHAGVLSQPGVTSMQPNWRNLQFGWNTVNSSETWTDLGNPGGCRWVCAMCVHEGDLFVGTFDDASDGRGHVYRMKEGGGWEDCGHLDDSNCILSLAEYRGRLYAGTMRYRASGSHIPDSPNEANGGRIFRYEKDGSWTLFAELPVEGNDSVGALLAHEGKLVAMSFYPYGIFAYDEDGECTDLGAPGPEGKTRTHVLTSYRGRLFVGCNEQAGVYSRTLDTPWVYSGTVQKCDQVYCFSTYRDELMMGIWREARMYAYAGDTSWSDRGLLGEELEVMGVSVFGGRLYAGTLPGGFVYRYDGDTTWTLSGVLEEQDPNVEYRRVWSMAVFKGRLIAGTLPGGKVWGLSGDPLATCDRGLSSGWHRAALVYDKERIALYLDGEYVSEASFLPNASSPSADAAALTGIPVTLGKGPQCHFSGKIREVELFDGALSPGEIATIHQQGGSA